MAINKENIIEMQLIKYNLFKEQNPEIGRYDVIFEVEGKILYAHKTMLNLVSDTFDSMLSDRWNSNKDGPIKIKDYTYDDFYQFITFLYSGQCQLTDSNIFTMVDVAEFYGVKVLKKYCDKYLAVIEITVFKLMDLADKYSMVQLKTSANDFIAIKNKVNPEELFQAIFKWCEKQAIDKQAANPNISLNETIKTEIADFLPHINFGKMELKFLIQYIVPRGFIFASLEELSKILNDCHSQTVFCKIKVKLTNDNGETLHGNVVPDKIVIDNIKSINLKTCYRGDGACCWWNTGFKIPTTPSPLKKRNGVKWYLVYYNNGDIGIKHQTYIVESNYLIAELTPGTSGFRTAHGCKIEIE